MTDKKEKAGSDERLTEDQRFKYVGFNVQPGKIKEFFKSGAEKDKYVNALKDKRSRGASLRDDCTLAGERITFGERLVLTAASLIIIGALFMPWYSAYTEIVEERDVAPVAVQEEILDTLAADEAAIADSGVVATTTETDPVIDEAAEAVDEVDAAATELAEADTAENMDETDPSRIIDEDGTEIITGIVRQAKVHREYEQMTGFGGLLSIGSVGSMLFSSGIVLILTTIIFLLYTVAAVGLPVYTLYTTWGLKAGGDEAALKLKECLKWSWWPVVGFVLAMSLSFVGASYGFDTQGMFTSIGQEYSIGVFMDSLSWGVYVPIAGFVLLAAKGMEI